MVTPIRTFNLEKSDQYEQLAFAFNINRHIGEKGSRSSLTIVLTRVFSSYVSMDRDSFFCIYENFKVDN